MIQEELELQSSEDEEGSDQSKPEKEDDDKETILLRTAAIELAQELQASWLDLIHVRRI